jgi:hypothetical protein
LLAIAMPKGRCGCGEWEDEGFGKVPGLAIPHPATAVAISQVIDRMLVMERKNPAG